MAFGYIGYTYYPKRNPCPVIASDTVIIHDTMTYTLKPDTITVYKIVHHSDTVQIPADIDSAAILKEYYSTFTYQWQQADTNIVIDGLTTITENRITDNSLQYHWLQPATIVNNIPQKINSYSRYLTIGVDIPIQSMSYAEIEALYVFRRGYLGAGYTPKLRSFNFKIGIPIIHFKN